MRAFFVRKFFQTQTLSREKSFVPKIRAKNADEIDNNSVEKISKVRMVSLKNYFLKCNAKL